MSKFWRFLFGAGIGLGLGYALVLIFQPRVGEARPKFRTIYQADPAREEEQTAA
jgi:hypothetical protein